MCPFLSRRSEERPLTSFLDRTYNSHPNKKPKWLLVDAMESQVARNDFFTYPFDFQVELVSF